MSKVTVAIDDNLLREVRQMAAEQGRTFQAVVNDLLRRALSEPFRRPYRLKLRGWKAKLQPGIDISDRNSLYEAMEAPRRDEPK